MHASFYQGFAAYKVVSWESPPINSCRLIPPLLSLSNNLKRFSAKPYSRKPKYIKLKGSDAGAQRYNARANGFLQSYFPFYKTDFVFLRSYWTENISKPLQDINDWCFVRIRTGFFFRMNFVFYSAEVNNDFLYCICSHTCMTKFSLRSAAFMYYRYWNPCM